MIVHLTLHHSFKSSLGRDLQIPTSNRCADLENPGWPPFCSPACCCWWPMGCGRLAHGHGSGSRVLRLAHCPLRHEHWSEGHLGEKQPQASTQRHPHSVGNSQAPVISLMLGEMQDVERIKGLASPFFAHGSFSTEVSDFRDPERIFPWVQIFRIPKPREPQGSVEDILVHT